MKHLILILWLEIVILFPISIQAKGDDAYCLNRQRETFILGGGVTLAAVGAFFFVNMNPPDPTHLRKEHIFRMDSFAVDFFNKEAALTSDITCALCIGLPMVSALSSSCLKTVRQDFIMYAESVLLVQGLVFLSKAIFQRPRPYAYRATESQTFGKDAARSFISGHTALAFNGAVFAGTVFQQRNPDCAWVKPIWIAGITTAAATAVFRLTSGNHFPTDVLAGAIVGSIGAWLIPRFHRCKRGEKGFSVFWGNGIGVSFVF